MKQYESYTGQPVWWLRQRAYNGAPVTRTPALVAQPPGPHNSLCGLALRRPLGRYEDEWYPMWAAPRNLAWRDVTTETIPAFFQALATFAKQCLENHYARLARLLGEPENSGIGNLIKQDILLLESRAAEVGLIFRYAGGSSWCLQAMTDCEFDAFIAASMQEVAS